MFGWIILSTDYSTFRINTEYLFTNIYTEKAYLKSKYEVPVTQCCKDITLHGFRKTIETWFADNCSLLNIRYDISDIILDHASKKGRSEVATQSYDNANYIKYSFPNPIDYTTKDHITSFG